MLSLESYASMLAEWLHCGRHEEVMRYSESLLAQWPTWGAGWKLRGICLALQGEGALAIAALDQAIRFGGPDAEVFNVKGALSRAAGDLFAARQFFEEALALRADVPEVHNNLGGTLVLLGLPEQGIAAFEEAIRLRPEYAEAHHGLGNALVIVGRNSEAVPVFREAFLQDRSSLGPLSMACHLAMQCCDWSTLLSDIDMLKSEVARNGWRGAFPFVVATLPGFGRAEQRDCASDFALRQYAGFVGRQPMVQRRTRGEGSLRVGLISADFHDHATSYLLAGVLECLSKERLEIIAYSFGPNDGGAMRHRIRAAVSHFCDCQGWSHEKIALQIASDAIDILIDLKGYTENSRPEVIALRPAPVVVNWLGYPGTMGCARLADYLIGDAIVTPVDHSADYSETLALMPRCYQPNDSAREIGDIPTKAEAGLPRTGFVFCSFNQAYKLTPGVFDIWCAILREAKDSVLWLLSSGRESEARVRAELVVRGVAGHRVIFAPKLPLSEHLARLRLADLALDTFPCNSHTTGSDALGAGVPLLTLMGDTFPSRVGASLVAAAGLPELAVDSWAAYIDTALHLWRSPEQRKMLTDRLKNARKAGLLFDTQGFARDFDLLLHAIWQHHAASKKGPVEVDVSYSFDRLSGDPT